MSIWFTRFLWLCRVTHRHPSHPLSADSTFKKPFLCSQKLEIGWARTARRLCLPEEHKHNPPADLLKRCLDAVLHICNDQKSPIENKGKEQKRGDNLRGCLTDYLTEWCGALFVPPAAHLHDSLAHSRTSNHENKGYMPLVQAFNHALHALCEIDVPLRKSTRESTDLLFHRNDPKNILSMHDGCRSRRKPDLVLVSLGVAKKDASSEEWADMLSKKPASRLKITSNGVVVSPRWKSNGPGDRNEKGYRTLTPLTL
jgi:hypothetical protein